MTNIALPSIINEFPRRCDIKRMKHIVHVGIALKVARNIHIRCKLAEAQNWRCCWCGTECVETANLPNSATIEHVQPRSLGGADEWENYAMACAKCNHKRGTLSVEDMLAGNFPKQKPNKKLRKKAKAVEKYIKKAIQWNMTGWTYSDGTPMCPKDWLDSLRLNEKHRALLEKTVFGEAA